MLREVWPARLAGAAVPLWHSRDGCIGGHPAWGDLRSGYAGPPLGGGVIVHLAGGRIDADDAVALAFAARDLGRRQGAAHVLVASSSAIYGAGTGRPLREDDPPDPSSGYGAGKAAMEAALHDPEDGQGPGVTFLRIGNVLGCDALIGRAVPGRPVVLDPVPGQAGGPVRSYIGPIAFAEVLARLCLRAMDGQEMPRVLNLAAAPPVAMGELLDAAGLAWSFGPPSPAVVGRVVLDVARLAALIGGDIATATAAGMVAEWRALQGLPA